jgi:hypothetical protein
MILVSIVVGATLLLAGVIVLMMLSFWSCELPDLTTASLRDFKPFMFVVDDAFGSKGRGSTFFVSYLPFQGAPASNPADIEPFNRTLTEGMRLLAAQNSNYAVNAPGHALGATDENAQKLIAILRGSYQTRGALRDRIIAELMTPNGIDGLVTGTFRQDERGSILVKAILVSKVSMRIPFDDGPRDQSRDTRDGRLLARTWLVLSSNLCGIHLSSSTIAPDPAARLGAHERYHRP